MGDWEARISSGSLKRKQSFVPEIELGTKDCLHVGRRTAHGMLVWIVFGGKIKRL